ncbi:hypothetical protein [Halobacillus litoralis]|uniref:hypothetical protein n=1 Tax=Halobacillus litoralis TaxID=45668 RepID=UPI001CFE9F6C|nr:hypothetical protein [Halobacillus litoralis]
MPKTWSGKMAGIVLGVFLVQFIVFIVLVLNNDGLGAIVNFIKLSPMTIILGLVFGIIGTKKEAGTDKVLPVLTSILSVVFAGFTWFFLYGWSFGG